MLFARAALVDLMENVDAITCYAGIIPVTKINKRRYWLLNKNHQSLLSDFGCFADSEPIYRMILNKLESISTTLAFAIHRSIRLHPEKIMVWRKRITDEYYPLDSFLLFVPIPPLKRITEEWNPSSEIASLHWCQPMLVLHSVNSLRLSGELLDFVNFWR